MAKKYVEMSADSEISLDGLFGEQTAEIKEGDKVTVLKDRAESQYIADVGDENVGKEATVTELVKWNVPSHGIVEGVLLNITGVEVIYDKAWLKKV